MKPLRHHLETRAVGAVCGLSLLALLVTLLFARRMPWSLEVDLRLVALWTLVAAAAIHRPAATSGLALGAGGLAWAVFHYPPLITGFLGVTALLVALLVNGVLEGTFREGFERWRRLLGGSASQLTAGLAAGWAVWAGVAAPLELGAADLYRTAALSGALYVGVLAGLELAQSFDAEGRLSWREPLLASVWEASAWAVGGILVAVAVALGEVPAFLLLGALTAVSLALLQREYRYRVVAAQARRLREIQLAGHRIIFGETDLLSIARQIFVECRRVVPFSWFHFQLAGDGGWQEGWWAGPEGMVRPGAPEPPPVPPPLPGFHRRAAWKVMERTLAGSDRTVGRLRLWCDPRRLDRDAEEWLEALLPEMTSSITGAILDLEARRDPLTGLADRRALEESLDGAFVGSQREGVPVAVIMCDLDHFKRLNDEHGHQAGDDALVAVARLLEEHQRDDDLCCRYGGEEFSIVLERTDGETALAVAERLRRAIDGFRFTAGGERISVTASAGVAAFPELHVKDAVELLSLADEALYEAKRQGRNRCMLNLGRGSFRGADGEIFGPDEPPPDIEAPTLFA